jgi:acyl-CoA synthetase (AMP-forming)/AMP-acid ligase II
MNIHLNDSLHSLIKVATLVDILRYKAQDQPNFTLYKYLENGEIESDSLTYQQLDKKARAIAAHLQSFIAFGERALLVYPPGLEFICAFFGCLYAGIVAVPAYPPRPNQSLLRLQNIVSDAQASVVLSTTSLLSNIENQLIENPELATIRWLTTDDLNSDLASDWQEVNLSETTLAFLQYTSGSTGTPKGVMVTHANLLHNSAVIYKAFECTANSHGVIWLPPYHDMGLIGGVIQPLYSGGLVVLMSPMAFLQKPLRWLKAISQYKATISGGPNFAYDLCIRKTTPQQRENLNLSSWEVAFNGSEPIRAETLEQFIAIFASSGFRPEAFYPCYGMAETTLIVTGGLKAALPVVKPINGKALEENKVVASGNQWESIQKVVGCGQTWLNLKVSIVDPNTLILCHPNQIGEIWVHGASVANGYWNQPDLTQKTFNAYITNTGEGPFLRTGDLGFFQDGELFVTGRLNDVIVIRGRNYYPQDIELTVEKSHPALRPDCGAAFTISVNGVERLVILQEVERSYLRKLNLNEVLRSIRQALTAEYSLPIYGIVLLKTGSILKTSSGKIQRQTCRAKFLAGNLDIVGEWYENQQF